MPGEFDHINSPRIICPYCGKWQNSTQLEQLMVWNRNGGAKCYDCGKEFVCIAHVSITFSTGRITGEGITI